MSSIASRISVRSSLPYTSRIHVANIHIFYRPPADASCKLSCRGQRFGPGSLWPISAGFRASWSCCAAAGRSECGEGWFEVAEVEGVFAELGEHGSRDVAGGSSSTVGDRVPEELP